MLTLGCCVTVRTRRNWTTIRTYAYVPAKCLFFDVICRAWNSGRRGGTRLLDCRSTWVQLGEIHGLEVQGKWRYRCCYSWTRTPRDVPRALRVSLLRHLRSVRRLSIPAERVFIRLTIEIRQESNWRKFVSTLWTISLLSLSLSRVLKVQSIITRNFVTLNHWVISRNLESSHSDNDLC